jgi:cytochrome c oxidase subunit IV
MASEPKPRGYLLNWVALIALTVLTFALAHVKMGPLNTPVAFVIALAKATLIASIFMHLIAERFTLRFILIGSAMFVALLTGVVLLDVLTRFPLTAPPGSQRYLQPQPGRSD